MAGCVVAVSWRIGDGGEKIWMGKIWFLHLPETDPTYRGGCNQIIS